ncbi:general odorant-binding protein 28a-like [Calliphora vicina]|uniref:general odorant-binding protein 28a-like n=1 Tax=Calliphora vicina TaxID=7373 RepID=UPI00325B087C
MKFLIVFAFLILAGYNIRAEVTKEEALAIATSCKEEVGASDADFGAIVQHQPTESAEGKCMLACVLKKFGVMSNEGKLIKDTAIEISKSLVQDEEEKEHIVAVIDTCNELDVSDDHCEAAEEYGHCWRTELGDKGIAPEDLV